MIFTFKKIIVASICLSIIIVISVYVPISLENNNNNLRYETSITLTPTIEFTNQPSNEPTEFFY